MSEKSIAVIPENIPSYILNPAVAAAVNEDAAFGIGLGAPPRIGFKNGKFRLIDSGGEETVLKPKDLVKEEYLGVVVLRARKPFEKAWYAKPYDPNDEPSAPDCFTLDGERPDPSSPLKQSETCAACPYNQFNSGKNAKGEPTKGKACPDKKVLAVYSAKGGGVYKLSIPPASLKNWAVYVKSLSTRGIPLGNVFTLVGLDDSADYQVLTFQFGGFIEEKHLPSIAEFSQNDESDMSINPLGGTPALPAPVAQDTAPKQEEEKPAPKRTRQSKKDKEVKDEPPVLHPDPEPEPDKEVPKPTAEKPPLEVVQPAEEEAEAEESEDSSVSNDELASSLGLL